MQNKRDEHLLKRRNVPHTESTDSEESEKQPTQSLETIVHNAASGEPAIQLSAVQSARYVLVIFYQRNSSRFCECLAVENVKLWFGRLVISDITDW